MSNNISQHSKRIHPCCLTSRLIWYWAVKSCFILKRSAENGAGRWDHFICFWCKSRFKNWNGIFMILNAVIDPIGLLLNFLHLEMKLHWDEIMAVVPSTASPTRCGLMHVALRPPTVSVMHLCQFILCNKVIYYCPDELQCKLQRDTPGLGLLASLIIWSVNILSWKSSPRVPHGKKNKNNSGM